MQGDKYICETDYSPSEIKAAVSDGTIEPWRRDAAGLMWFKFRSHELKAIPPAVAENARIEWIRPATGDVQLEDEQDTEFFDEEDDGYDNLDDD